MRGDDCSQDIFVVVVDEITMEFILCIKTKYLVNRVIFSSRKAGCGNSLGKENPPSSIVSTVITILTNLLDKSSGSCLVSNPTSDAVNEILIGWL